DMAHLALLLELHQGRRQHVAMVFVGRRTDGVEMEDVDMVEAEPPQCGLHLARHRLGRVVAGPEQRLGRDHQPVAVMGADGSADDLLGAIGLGGVDEIDAEIDRRAHHRHAVVEAGAATAAQAAVAAAAQPRDADREPGLSKGPVFHHPLLLGLVGSVVNVAGMDGQTWRRERKLRDGESMADPHERPIIAKAFGASITLSQMIDLLYRFQQNTLDPAEMMQVIEMGSYFAGKRWVGRWPRPRSLADRRQPPGSV